MNSGFGIAALIVFFLSLGVPIFGNFITLLALVLVVFAALGRNVVWPIAIVAASAVKLFFLSPSWMILMAGPDGGAYFLVTIVFLAAPIVALLIRMASGAPASEDTAPAYAYSPPPPPQPRREAPAAVGDDIADWDRIANKDDPDNLQEYLLRHPNGRFAELARMKLERMGVAPLKPPEPAPALAPPPAPAAPPPPPRVEAPPPPPRFESFSEPVIEPPQRRGPPIAVIIVAALAVLGVGGYFAVRALTAQNSADGVPLLPAPQGGALSQAPPIDPMVEAADIEISDAGDPSAPARGWIGVRVSNVQSADAARTGLNSRDGAVIRGVADNGPAAQAGLLAGDVVLRFAGNSVADGAALVRMIAETPPGSDVVIELMRERTYVSTMTTVQSEFGAPTASSGGGQLAGGFNEAAAPVGAWRGTMYQGSRSYTLAARLYAGPDNRLSADIDYVELNCGGSWLGDPGTALTSGPWVVRETISRNRSRCIDGLIYLTPSADGGIAVEFRRTPQQRGEMSGMLYPSH